MHEHIARALYYLEVHLLYSSIVCLAAWILTSIRQGSATTKHWIWLATSLNFILPVGAVLDKVWAPHLSWATPLSVIGSLGDGISRNAPLAVSLFATWLLGAILMLTRLCLRIRVECRDLQVVTRQSAFKPTRDFLVHGVPVKFIVTRQGPAIDGFLRPHISLPHGIDRLLSAPELDAVLIHELTHAKRRDNLIRLINEVTLCGLWFHPLVWITGSRLALYRELSCDESVIRSARGADLVSALAKLADSGDALLLRAAASSFISHRLARLAVAQPPRRFLAANTLLITAFAAVLLAGILGTVAHTACCFLART